MKSRGYDVCGYFSRTQASAIAAASFAGTSWYGSVEELAEAADMIFLTVNDDQIRLAAENLYNIDLALDGKIFVHMSGALASGELDILKKRGGHTYSLHPLLSFAEPGKAWKRIEDAVFSVEGDSEKMQTMTNLLENTGCSFFEIETDKKALYHAAACVASNYVTVLLDYAFSLYLDMGLSRQDAAKALLPLAKGTVQNAEDGGPEKTLTGPISRGDAGVIRRHMDAFEKSAKDKEDFYRFMGLQTVDYASRYGLQPEEKIKEMKKILNRGELDG
ncbi:MAG: hypothetical protein C0604_06270 [Clostridiales bacterium]|nr:MAG: hypothetical protein C0604_06270 [Clostridiales bacterium]